MLGLMFWCDTKMRTFATSKTFLVAAAKNLT
jgi:hypothetical protein